MILKLNDGKLHDVCLEDDGTMDTIVVVDGQMTMRFDSEYTAELRRDDGSMTEDGLTLLGNEVIADYDPLGEE